MPRRSPAPAPAEIHYHATALRVLEAAALLSRSALRKIERSEAKCGARLPASVREWYSLENAEKLLTHHEGDCGPVPLDRVLKLFAKLQTARRNLSPRRLPIYGCTSSGYGANLFLDGSDDPPVIGDAMRDFPYSEFVLEMAWDCGTDEMRPYVFLPDSGGVLGPPQLDFLIENFNELPRGIRLDTLRNPFRPSLGKADFYFFRFYGHSCRIRIRAEGDPAIAERPASWDLHADSEEQLFTALRFLWPCWGEGIQFYSGSQPDEQMAARFAAKRATKLGRPAAPPAPGPGAGRRG